MSGLERASNGLEGVSGGDGTATPGGAARPEPMLRLEGVSKVFSTGAFGGGEMTAVRDVSFDVAQREVIALVGESGSGKTTLGRMILRLASVTRGRILFDGQDVAGLRRRGLKDYYRKVQGVFQDPFSSYNPIFKADRIFSIVRDEFYPEVRGGDWEEKVEATLRAVSLNPGDVLHKFPHQLSGGQLQRLLVARALLLDIRLLVADEIISMLDASTRIDVLNLLGDLKERGLGVIFITHDLSLGNYISDRTVILRRGSIAEIGPTAAVFGSPAHPYTRSLLAAVPQLHERWEAIRSREAPASGTSGAEAAGGPGTVAAGSSGARGGHERYSRSDLHPSNGSVEPRAARARRERSDRGHEGLADVGSGATEPAEVLVEVGPGHFVARPESGRVELT